MTRKLVKFFFNIFILLATFLCLFVGIVYLEGFGPISNNKELTEIKSAQASVVYSADDKIIGKFFHTNRTNISYNKLPEHLINALVATEDSRFYEHKGIDKIAMLRVVFKTIILGNSSSGGGSTISQQLAKNLYKRKDFAFLSMPVNKTKEAILANRLESIYTKQEILTLYLNTVPFGENVYGIESAAQRFFSVPAQKLSLEQSAILIGMLKANSYYNPRRNPEHALRRRNTVLGQMEKAGYLTHLEYLRTKKKPIKIKYKNLVRENPNGYFLKQVKNKAQKILNDIYKEDGSNWKIQNDGLIIETTLISELQESALSSRKSHLMKLQKSMDAYWRNVSHKKEFQNIINKEWRQTKTYKYYKSTRLSKNEIKKKAKKKKNRNVFNWTKKDNNYSHLDSISHYLKMVNAAVYGVNTQSGAVQIYVGGNNFESLPYNLITSERQVASTFKPIVYTAALENGQKPCDWINNEVTTYAKFNNWKPENYNHSSGGYYSMVGALAKSANVPTVATYFKVGDRKLQQTANALGLTKELRKSPATALGTTNFSLQNIVHAYIPFATRSYQIEPYYITSIKDSKGNIIYQHPKVKQIKVDLNPETLETMQLLLKGVVDKGTATKLKSRYHAKGDWAGKTGTSQDYSDSWFIGFNSNMIIGTWVGCKYPSIHLPSSIGGGSVAALPIVGQIISKNYKAKTIQRNLSAGFPSFDEDILESCDCESYREENALEKLLDVVFDKKEMKKEKTRKKENFFTRFFKRRK